ncbi:MauE/DoxX family redox-associated membrane protein [Melioribacteraceae bacterium 4301-Me]|uniref:MauE/DoxX family redox-associated membrane protein n=1 Tax=Pyranulibacter aquaticus TaxID=3163344 RepID=UPI00359BBBDE
MFLLYGIYCSIIRNASDCGCFGNAIKSDFGWGMVGRNAFLLLLSIVVLKKENRNAWRRAK